MRGESVAAPGAGAVPSRLICIFRMVFALLIATFSAMLSRYQGDYEPFKMSLAEHAHADIIR